MPTNVTKTLGRVILLATLVWLLYAIDFAGLGLSEAALSAPWAMALMALVDAVVLSFAVLQAHKRRGQLVMALFLLYFGVKTGLVAAEAVYLSDLLPVAVALALLVNGGIVTAIAAFAAVALVEPRQSGRRADPRSCSAVVSLAVAAPAARPALGHSVCSDGPARIPTHLRRSGSGSGCRLPGGLRARIAAAGASLPDGTRHGLGITGAAAAAPATGALRATRSGDSPTLCRTHEQ